jgi:putative DNA-invertase from lambdoid prophage Rac
MMGDARRGSFDVLLVWALDRVGRSMVDNLRDVLELGRLGVQIVSLREPWLDTGGPVRDLLLAIFSWVAQQERLRFVERTKAGIDP